MTIDRNKAREIICSCSGTTAGKIKTLIAAKRAHSLPDICRITGACTGCGACETTIEELLVKLNACAADCRFDVDRDGK